MPPADRHWLLTWTTYGSWLPGDERGSVTPVRDAPGPRLKHNRPRTDYDSSLPGLARSARSLLKSPPIRLTLPQAEVILAQFHETAQHRGWTLLAVAIMRTHIHIVIGVPGDPDPDTILRDFKSYASRALNRSWTKPASGTWWTESGSKRKLPDEPAVLAAVRYVAHQPAPLLIWIADLPEFASLRGERSA
jgi:REP element-mobilizing transposase RayT